MLWLGVAVKKPSFHCPACSVLCGFRLNQVNGNLLISWVFLTACLMVYSLNCSHSTLWPCEQLGMEEHGCVNLMPIERRRLRKLWSVLAVLHCFSLCFNRGLMWSEHVAFIQLSSDFCSLQHWYGVRGL